MCGEVRALVVERAVCTGAWRTCSAMNGVRTKARPGAASSEKYIAEVMGAIVPKMAVSDSASCRAYNCVVARSAAGGFVHRFSRVGASGDAPASATGRAAELIPKLPPFHGTITISPRYVIDHGVVCRKTRFASHAAVWIDGLSVFEPKPMDWMDSGWIGAGHREERERESCGAQDGIVCCSGVRSVELLCRSTGARHGVRLNDSRGRLSSRPARIVDRERAANKVI